MKKNNRGFAITAIIYSILIIVIILMTLVLAIISFRRQTVEKIQERVKKETSVKKSNSSETSNENTLYKIISSAAKIDTSVVFKYDINSKSGVDYPIVNMENGVFKSADNIYYYRGAVINNYVLFKNYCWQIVRTTDTEGVKMIYSGVASNGKCNLEPKNLILKIDAYVDANGVSKPNYPNIATEINKFYESNLKSSEALLENLTLCDENDSAWNRLLNNNPNFNACNIKSSFKIGLLSADEAMYAGGVLATEAKVRLNYYLRIPQTTIYDRDVNKLTYMNINFVTSSTGTASDKIIYVGAEGQIADGSKTGSWNKFGVRPVISLKKGVMHSGGTGSYDNPYIIK